jgi:thiamine biosynthesis lipoprotein
MVKKNSIWIKLFFSALSFFFVSCTNNNPTEKKYKRYELAGYTQGTTYQVSYIDSSNRRDYISQKVDSILNDIDNSLSTYNPNSKISKFNTSDSCFLIDNHILNLFLLSDEVNSITDGAFDPSVKPLVNLWGFGANPINLEKLFNNVGDSTLRDSLIKAYRDSMSYDLTDFVGFEYFMLDGDIVYNTFEEMLNGDFNDNFLCKDDSTVQITFDAVAQGYTSDIIGDYLNFEMGIGDFLVNVGGEIVAQGRKKDNRPWMVSIEHPNIELEDGLDEIARVKMDSNYRAIAVSGNYRKFREEGKRKIVHSIDPRNGQPSETNVLSATVLSDEAAICDAYATAFMIMRIEDIIPLIESNNLNIDALIIFHDANNNLQTYVSTNLEDKLLYPVSQP